VVAVWGGLCVVLVGANATAWWDGVRAVGAIDAYRSSLAIYAVVGVAAIHYLDDRSRSALTRIRPALSIDDEEARRFEYELTTLPAYPALAWSLGGIAFAAIFIATGFDVSLQLERMPLSFLFELVVSLIAFPALAVFVFHTIRQLRIISRIHARAAAVNVFHLDPLYAFSSVTARTGAIALLLAYVSAATDPATFSNPTLLAFVGLAVLVGLACFVLPLEGIHRRIATAKVRLASEANANLQIALGELNRSVRESELDLADPLHKQLSSLVIERDIIARIPTWPWQPTTFRGFATAVVLPIALWLVYRILDRLLA
jgi:hypothetical protein